MVGGKKGGFKKVSYPVYFKVYNRLALGIILKISDLLFFTAFVTNEEGGRKLGIC